MQAVLPVSLNFEPGAEVKKESDKTVVIPRVSFKKRSLAKVPTANNENPLLNADMERDLNFIEMRPLAGIKNAADRVREQERAQLDQSRNTGLNAVGKSNSAGDAVPSADARSVPPEYLSSLRASQGS